MRMEILYRVLHRDYMSLSAFVDTVYHAGKRCRFARTRRACDQHQSGPVVSQRENILRNAKCRRIRDAEPDHSDDRGQRTSLSEDIHSESAEISNGEREIIINGIVEIISVASGHIIYLSYYRVDRVGFQDPAVLPVLHPFDLKRDRNAGYQENV